MVPVVPAAVNPVARITVAPRQSLSTNGTGLVAEGEKVTDASLSTGMSASTAKLLLTLNTGSPDRAECRTRTSLPPAGTGLPGITASSAGTHAVLVVASNPY